MFEQWKLTNTRRELDSWGDFMNGKFFFFFFFNCMRSSHYTLFQICFTENLEVKGIVDTKIKMCIIFPHLQAIKGMDDFVSS